MHKLYIVRRKTLAETVRNPSKHLKRSQNGFKQVLPAQKSSEDGRYRSEDGNIERHENAISKLHIYRQHVQMLRPKQLLPVPNSDLNASFYSKSPSENNCNHHHTKNSNTSTEFRSNGIILIVATTAASLHKCLLTFHTPFDDVTCEFFHISLMQLLEMLKPKTAQKPHINRIPLATGSKTNLRRKSSLNRCAWNAQEVTDVHSKQRRYTSREKERKKSPSWSRCRGTRVADRLPVVV